MSAEHSPTRRDFLQGQAALDAIQDAVASTGADAQVAQPGHPGYLLTVTRRAMACKFAVHLNIAEGGAAVEAAVGALDLVEALEGQMTVYRETSDVLEINRLALHEPVVVEPRLFELLQRAQRISRETSGAFDITSGPLSDIWGFSMRQGRVPDDAALNDALQCVGYQNVVLDEDEQTVRFSAPGVGIQLNGIGKGYALDRAAALLTITDASDNSGSRCVDDRRGEEEATPRRSLSATHRRLSTSHGPQSLLDGNTHPSLDHFLFHGGQSSVLARGSNAARPDGGWSVGVRHPLRPTEQLGEIVLRDAALGTSGSATQSFHSGGRRFGHILDPRTGAPAEGVFTSTVVAPSAAKADALATAMFVLGPSGANRYCTERPEIGALLVCPGDRAGEIVVHAFNLANDVWQPR